MFPQTADGSCLNTAVNLCAVDHFECTSGRAEDPSIATIKQSATIFWRTEPPAAKLPSSMIRVRPSRGLCSECDERGRLVRCVRTSPANQSLDSEHRLLLARCSFCLKQLWKAQKARRDDCLHYKLSQALRGGRYNEVWRVCVRMASIVVDPSNVITVSL